jgi:hypothetical protein
MNTHGSVSFQSGTYYNAAGGTLTGANNGTSLDGTGKIVQLGSTAAPAGALLNNRIIDLATFRLRFNRGLSTMDFNGGTTQPMQNISWSVVQNPGAPVVNIRASDHGALQFKLWQPSNTDDSSNEFLMPAGFFDDEGFSAKIDFDAGNLSYVRLSSLASNDFAIGTGVNFAAAPIRFLIQDAEAMRINDDTTGTFGFRNVTDPASAYIYLQPTASGNPGLNFLKEDKSVIASLSNAGAFSAAILNGTTSVNGGAINGSNFTATGLMACGTTIKTGDPGSGAVTWRLGNRIVAVSALDTTAYVEVKINNIVRKLALIV